MGRYPGEQPAHRRPAPDRDTSGRTALSWAWAIAPIVTLGFATAPCMLVVARRVHHWAHYLLAALYSVALLTILIVDPDHGARSDQLFNLAMATNVGLGLGHALVVRRRAFGFPKQPIPQPAEPPEPAEPTVLDRQRAELADLSDRLEARDRARQVVRASPNQAVELRIGRIDLTDRTFPDGGLIDVNNVPVPALVAELTMLVPYADRLAQARAVTGGFDSVNDLSLTLDLPPDLLDMVDDRLVFLPRYEARPPGG